MLQHAEQVPPAHVLVPCACGPTLKCGGLIGHIDGLQHSFGSGRQRPHPDSDPDSDPKPGIDLIPTLTLTLSVPFKLDPSHDPMRFTWVFVACQDVVQRDGVHVVRQRGEVGEHDDLDQIGHAGRHDAPYDLRRILLPAQQQVGVWGSSQGLGLSRRGHSCFAGPGTANRQRVISTVYTSKLRGAQSRTLIDDALWFMDSDLQ